MAPVRRAVCAALAWVFLSGTARAQDAAAGSVGDPSVLARAHSAYEAGDLRAALSLFAETLRAGGQDPHTLADVYLHLGLLRGIDGDREAAREAFDVALAIEPALERPAEIGPTLGGVFDGVRESRAGRRLHVVAGVDGETSPSGPPTLHAQVVDAPDGLIRRVRVVLRDGGGRERVLGEAEYAGETLLTLPADHGLPPGTTELTVVAITEFGGTAAETTVPVVIRLPVEERAEPEPVAVIEARSLRPIVAEPALREPEPSRRGILASPWFWLGVGVVAAAAGGAVVWVASTPEDHYIFGPPAFVEATPP